MVERAKTDCECGQHVATSQMKQHVTGRVHREFLATANGGSLATLKRPSDVIQQTQDLAAQGAYLPPDGREPSTYVPPRLEGAAAALEAAVAAKPPEVVNAPQAPAAALAGASYDPREHAARVYKADQSAHPGEHAYEHIASGVDQSSAFMPHIKDGQPQVDLVTGGRNVAVPPLVAGERDPADPEVETQVIANTAEPHALAAAERVVDAPGSGPLGRDYNMFAERPGAPTVRSMQEGAGVPNAAPAGRHVAAGEKDVRRITAPPPDAADGVMDDYSQALGSSRYTTPFVFDDPEERMRNFQGFRLKFSRFYFDQGVLVDIFAQDTTVVRTEVAEKSRAIATWNIDTPDMRLGYIPIILGVQLDFEVAVMALRGKIAPLQVRQPYQ